MAKRMKLTWRSGMMKRGSYKLSASFMRKSHTPTNPSHPTKVT
jgi:hypothetical protein